MARAQSQYLRIYDAAGVTYQRWQNYYANTSVTWQNQKWLYVPFIADGITAGISGVEGNLSIQTAATSMVLSAFETALYEKRLVELNIYQFNAAAGNDEPQVAQTIIANFVGQMSGGSATLTSVKFEVGSALSPVGAQIPPRKFTTAIMGLGVRS